MPPKKKSRVPQRPPRPSFTRTSTPVQQRAQSQSQNAPQVTPSPASARKVAVKLPEAEPVYDDGWTDEQEITLFKAISIYRWKPAGMHKHFRMLSITNLMSSHGVSDAHTRPPGIWKKLGTLYDLKLMDEREDMDDDVIEGKPPKWTEFRLPKKDYGGLMAARMFDTEENELENLHKGGNNRESMGTRPHREIIKDAEEEMEKEVKEVEVAEEEVEEEEESEKPQQKEIQDNGDGEHLGETKASGVDDVDEGKVIQGTRTHVDSLTRRRGSHGIRGASSPSVSASMARGRMIRGRGRTKYLTRRMTRGLGSNTKEGKGYRGESSGDDHSNDTTEDEDASSSEDTRSAPSTTTFRRGPGRGRRRGVQIVRRSDRNK